MRPITIRRAVGILGLTAAVSAASLVAPAGATVLTGTTTFKMISGGSRVRDCKVGDLLSQAVATWTLNSNGTFSVAFGGAAKQTCLSLYSPGASKATALLSYQNAKGVQLASKEVDCVDDTLVLPVHCPFPTSADFGSTSLRKVVITFTQTSPAAATSTTTITPPSGITESDSFTLISGLSRVRNCEVLDGQSQATAVWTYRSTGPNSIVMSGPGHVCITMFRPGNSNATAVVTYKNTAGAVLATRTVNCVDTAAVKLVDCPFPASTDVTLPGLAQVTISFTQTNPAAVTSSTTLFLGD